jgi:hypothetical protein
MTLYKLQLLLQGYPILNYIIKNVYIIQEGQSPKSTYVQIEYKDFVNK